LDDNQNFICKYSKAEQTIKIYYKPRKDLDITFLTVHRSKGLQADYVFILNNKDANVGFPSKVTDSPILRLLLDNTERYPFAEERRLFYVALTRAKKKVFLLTEKDRESLFVKELENSYRTEIRKESKRCPICGGILQYRKGKHGPFMGCSNYFANGCKYTRSIKDKENG
jgi:DNA helicase-4